MFLAVFFFWRASIHLTVRSWLLVGLFSGLALLTKFTSLLFGPIFLILAVLAAYRRKAAPLDLFKGMALAMIIAVVVIGAGYNLSFDPTMYYFGLRNVYSPVTSRYQFYLLGEASTEPWW